jgi:hypothetical protein
MPKNTPNPALAMKFEFTGNLTDIYYHEKSDQYFLTFKTGENTFNFSAGDVDHEEIPVCEKLKFVGLATGIVYSGSQKMQLLDLQFKPV